MNYLDVCRTAVEAGDADAAQVVDALAAVLSGSLKAAESEYPCQGTDSRRWFRSRISSLGTSRGAVVAHLEIAGPTG